MSERKPPYLGAAYYPEDWPEEELERDIARMKEIGLNTVRIAEFAWHRMEPRPGEFDFSYFHKVVDRLHAAGIAVILGTPTATPPRWLSRLYPDVMAETVQGRQQQHGGRRHCCANNAHYNEYCMRIVEKMAQEFAEDPAVIGWQIDNEIYSDMGCFCPDCVGKFQESLREKFGTIDALNEAWNLNLFSQWYDDFADIPAPRDAWHNPHLIMEWRIFQNESNIRFVHRQADILHKYVKVPVGTDVMPVNGLDYRRLNQKLDIVQFNHYNVPENLQNAAFWFDYLRTMQAHPFWNTETATCWNGHVTISQSIKPEGYCAANSWMPIALGGEANLYWLWRTHWAGHELMHGAVIDTSGRDIHTVGEVKQVAEGCGKAAEFLRGTRVKPDLAIHFTSRNWNMRLAQPVVQGMEYLPEVIEHFYSPAVQLGLRPDVIDAAQPLSAYRLIVSPLMMTLEEYDLPERMAEWVKAGGTWVVGPMTDVRNADGARYRDRFYGMLEALTGVRWCFSIPDREGHIQAAWADGMPFAGKSWFELQEDRGADTLVRVTGGHSAIVGKSLVVKTRVGKGCVIQVGTLPGAEDAEKLLRIACEESGTAIPPAEGKLMVSPRQGEKRGLMLVEYGNGKAAYTLNTPMRDVLSGETVSGRLELSPYEVRVLEAL